MVAYRAGRVPRYYVVSPVILDRASSFDHPLQSRPSPSSMGWRTLPFRHRRQATRVFVFSDC